MPLRDEKQIQAAHDLLASIVQGETDIDFAALSKNAQSIIALRLETLCWVLFHATDFGEDLVELRQIIAQAEREKAGGYTQ